MDNIQQTVKQLQNSRERLIRELLTLTNMCHSLIEHDRAEREKQSLLKRMFTPFRFSSETHEVIETMEKRIDELKQIELQIEKLTDADE